MGILVFFLSTSYIVFRVIERNMNEHIAPTNDIMSNIKIYDKHIMQENITQEKKTNRQLQLKEMKKKNEDIVAWIEIENTNINYPILYGNDNNYYVTHNYKKEKSKDGALFLDARYDFTIPSTNLIIYGHNNQNGKMFSTLINYKNNEFYKAHPIIRYTTIEQEAEYEIIAVFYSRVYYQNEKDVFRYYYFINSKDKNQFDEYVNNSKKLSIYDTGKTATYGEQLLTLSTCSYHIANGRFVVVAKKIEI